MSVAKEGNASKLTWLGIVAHPRQIMTSTVAAANDIQRRKGNASVYVIGEQGLCDALKVGGCLFSEERADDVVVGIDRDITYEKIATASLLIPNRSDTFIFTNKDPAMPSERGVLPGNGALTIAIQTVSGKKLL